MKCPDCKLEIEWFKDYDDDDWYGCECEAEQTKEAYMELIQK